MPDEANASDDVSRPPDDQSPLSKWSRRNVLAMGGALGLGLGGAASAVATGHGSTPAPVETRTNAVPSEWVGNFFGAAHGGGRTEFFDDAGLGWIRQGVGWQNREPEEDVYDWDRLDMIYEDTRERNLGWLPVINYTPDWLSSGSTKNHPPTDTSEFPEFIEKMIERYPELEYYELWNEPNLYHFWRVGRSDQKNLERYVDEILIPGAKVLHEHGKKVVAPSVTTEWWDWDVGISIEGGGDGYRHGIDAWLEYNDAWKHIDIVSFHYTKGDIDDVDTGKSDSDKKQDMTAYYDYLHENYVETGKIDGIWNTEEGLTRGNGPDENEAWEEAPKQQWVARYVVPVLHWALDSDWEFEHQYKLFWYDMNFDKEPRSWDDWARGTRILEKNEQGELQLSDTGHALRTLSDQVTSGDVIGTYLHDVTVGRGLDGDHAGSETFDHYTFTVGDDVFLAAWVPGNGEPVDVVLDGVEMDTVDSIATVDYITGSRETVEESDYQWVDLGTGDRPSRLSIDAGEVGAPVFYLRINRR